jgi:patatin-related protein
MREKELRLALICYGGISLAVYMHGITKEVWHLARASLRHHAGEAAPDGSSSVYQRLIALMETEHGLRVRVLPDIIAGASAGGINGIFLAQAIATGQSLEPLTKLWLESADIDQLLDPEARRSSFIGTAWSVPFARSLIGAQNEVLAATVAPEARNEVRAKLAQFLRSRWFAPPFGGATFTNLLLNAFDAMADAPSGKRLLPRDQPLDLFVTVTDFFGYKQRLTLNSPAEIAETEHRLILAFHDKDRGLGAAQELAYAARATASFPGAFPPFTVQELDQVLKTRKVSWPGRNAFLRRVLPRDCTDPDGVVLIDGSVLANAPFKPAIAALKDRPARREIDRRFVYIDPTPGGAAIGAGLGEKTSSPGFFTTILGALSGIPREQPIHDSLEALDARSGQIRRMRKIIEALRPDVEAVIEKLFGTTLLLDYPTPERLRGWRENAESRAIRDAGYACAAYRQVKLSAIFDSSALLLARLGNDIGSHNLDSVRTALWDWARADGLEHQIGKSDRRSAARTAAFFQTHDLGFRIRRLRFVIRRLTELGERLGTVPAEISPLRVILYGELAAYLDREALAFYEGVDPTDASAAFRIIGERRNLAVLDMKTDATLATALGACSKSVRRAVMLAYLGFPYYDIATLPLLQGEGLDEFDPIRVDRIAPDDATLLRAGGAQACLKGIEFHNFGAFFSRAYRENDYLWGRLHGAERLIDILVSTLPAGMGLSAAAVRAAKLDASAAILSEERARLGQIDPLIAALMQDIETARATQAA